MFTLQELIAASQGTLRQGPEAVRVRGISIDTRTIKKHDAFIAIKGDTFDGHRFVAAAVKKGAACVLVKKGEHFSHLPARVCVIEVDDTVKALGRIAAFHRKRFAIPVIAITGSSGKTTTKEMAACTLGGPCVVLKNQGTQNNHIGLPLTLLKLKPAHKAAVVELGTNHPGEIGYLAGICAPTVGLITNIGPAHLEYFGSLRGVMQEKYSLIDHLQSPGITLLNHDDPFLKKKIRRAAPNPFTVSFGLRTPSDFTASGICFGAHTTAFRVNKKYGFTLNTTGCHNVYNALAAVSLARVFGVTMRECARRLREFRLPCGRGRAFLIQEARFIDDTYNSNPASLHQSLRALASLKHTGRKICVLGDMLELGPGARAFHQKAGKSAASVCDVLIAVGPWSKITAESACVSGLSRRSVFTCDSSREARKLLFDAIDPGRQDVVLVKGSRGMKMEEVLLGP